MDTRLLLIFVILPLFSAQPCPLLYCNGTFTEFGCAKSLVMPKQNLWYLRKCATAAKPYCDFYPANNTESLCQAARIELSFPGEYCEKNEDCLSGSCATGLCKGKILKDKCADDSECNAGMYCSNAMCTMLSPLGGPCGAGVQCQVGSVCNIGKCVAIGSLKDGTASDNYLACASMSMKNRVCIVGSKAAANIIAAGYVCPAVKYCSYTDGSTAPCLCGISSDGLKRCNKGKGETNPQNYIAYAATIVKDFSKCHISKGVLCLYKNETSMPKEFYLAYKTYVDLMNSLSVMANPDCAKNTLNRLYWTAVRMTSK